MHGTGGSSAGVAGVSETPRPLQYILADPYDRLAIEIDSVPGFEPRAPVEALLVDRLAQILDKPGGIRVLHDESLDDPGHGHAWTFEELRALGDATFDPAPRDGEIRIHVMFVDGGYTSPDSGATVLGLAWGNTHIAVFEETIAKGCRSTGLGLTDVLDDRACADAQYGIWLHEVGHVLGLVDNGLAMVEPHQDAEHPAHDASEDCIMYWAYEGTPLFDRIAAALRGDMPRVDFDANCLADIAAAKTAP